MQKYYVYFISGFFFFFFGGGGNKSLLVLFFFYYCFVMKQIFVKLVDLIHFHPSHFMAIELTPPVLYSFDNTNSSVAFFCSLFIAQLLHQ